MKDYAIIGDVHSKMDEYISLTHQYKKTIQIGDMGFDYSRLRGEVDYFDHTFFKGNHDNYNKGAGDTPHDLGDYGKCTSPFPFFFIRGAYSIDKQFRTIGLDWWEEEELTYRESIDCLIKYSQVCPRVVLSHAAPSFLIPDLTNGGPPFINRTAELLESCWNNWKSDVFIFCHMHTSFAKKIGKTLFICLDELETFEVDWEGNYEHGGFTGKVKMHE